MIQAADAIACGRGLLGTPYSTYDCINYIKKIIRTAPGGNPKYTTAGTNTLWRSSDLQNKRKGVSDAKPGEVVFKWKSQDTEKYPDGKGDFHHIGLVTERGTVMHSSSVDPFDGYAYIDGVRKKVHLTSYDGGGVGAIETDLDSKWAYTATHKLITPEGGEHVDTYLYAAKVVTNSGTLRLRNAPISGDVIAKIPKGATVYVLDEENPYWPKTEYSGYTGYCSAEYLERIDDPTPTPDPDPDPEPGKSTWGVFVPCDSMEDALGLVNIFKYGVVCQREVKD